MAASLESVVVVQEGIVAYWREHQQLPTSLRDVSHQTSLDMEHVSRTEWDSAGALIIRFDSVIQDRMNIDYEPTVILKAIIRDAGIEWNCTYGTVGNWYRPKHCRMGERR